MSEELCLVISRFEDEPHIKTYSKSQLQKKLVDGDFEGYDFLKNLDGISLMEFPSRSVIIVKGEVIKEML